MKERQSVARAHAGSRACGTLLLVAILTLAGCAGAEDVAGDRALRFREPGQMHPVTLPVTLRWDGELREGELFAVFVDRGVLPPGKDFQWLAEEQQDQACLSRRGCPDEDWLASRNIHITEEPRLTLRGLPDRPGSVGKDEWFHEIAVVRVDRRGRRLGEAAAVLELAVDSEVEAS